MSASSWAGLPPATGILQLVGFVALGVLLNQGIYHGLKVAPICASSREFWARNDVLWQCSPLWNYAVSIFFQAVLFPLLVLLTIYLFYEGAAGDYYENSGKKWQQQCGRESDFSLSSGEEVCLPRVSVFVFILYLTKDAGMPFLTTLENIHHAAGLIWCLVFLVQKDGANGFILGCSLMEFANTFRNLTPLVISLRARQDGIVWGGGGAPPANVSLSSSSSTSKDKDKGEGVDVGGFAGAGTAGATTTTSVMSGTPASPEVEDEQNKLEASKPSSGEVLKEQQEDHRAEIKRLKPNDGKDEVQAAAGEDEVVLEILPSAGPSSNTVTTSVEPSSVVLDTSNYTSSGGDPDADAGGTREENKLAEEEINKEQLSPHPTSRDEDHDEDVDDPARRREDNDTNMANQPVGEEKEGEPEPQKDQKKLDLEATLSKLSPALRYLRYRMAFAASVAFAIVHGPVLVICLTIP